MKALALILLLIVFMLQVMTGCGGGETLPLFPEENACDRPPDPHWQILVPLAGQRIPLAGVWTEQDNVWVVGSQGLVLSRIGPQHFVRESVPTVANLHSVAALDNGVALAVGGGGTVLERDGGSGGRWQLASTAVEVDLNLVVTTTHEAWAVGQAGTVLRRQEGGSWDSLDLPGPWNLRGAAVKGDTLAVCGDHGQLWLRVGDQWLDHSGGPWLEVDLHSVIWLPDGRLVAMGREFYVRSAQGWQLAPYEQPFWSQPSFRAIYRGGHIYVSYQHSIRKIDPSGTTWSGDHITHSSRGAVAVKDSLNLLLVNESRELIWSQEGLPERYDPAGEFDWSLFQLNDGTCGVSSSEGMFLPASEGLQQVVSFGPEINPHRWRPRAVVGQGLADFYFNIGDELWCQVDGQLQLVTTVPGGIYDLALDGQGLVHIASTNPGLLAWDGTQLQVTGTDEMSGNQLWVSAHGTALTYHGSQALYYREGLWIPLSDLGGRISGEVSPGELAFFNSNPASRSSIWRMGVGLVSEGPFQPLPGCPQVDFVFGVDHESGMHIVSEMPSLVMRLEGNPLLGNWDLVAGPTEYQIYDLVVGIDGSLLAKANQTRSLLHYGAH